MRTRNAMQFKAHINARAKEAGIPVQYLMQSYLFERLLERPSRSEWRDNVVIKVGMLVSSLACVASRMTMDFDATITGFTLSRESSEKLETAILRGVTNTRLRDFYDIHLLWGTRGDKCEIPTLREKLERICTKRGSLGTMARRRPAPDEVVADKTMLAL